MSIQFSSRPHRTQAWENARELAGFLSRCDAGSVFLGEELENPANLYSVTLYLGEDGNERFGIGVATAGAGMPHLLVKPQLGIVMVGVDHCVRGIDVENRSLSFKVDCYAPFSQLVEVADGSVTLVFHGEGVVALAEDGWELWRSNVGRIVDWACEDSTLFLRLQDAPTAKLDVRTGVPHEARS